VIQPTQTYWQQLAACARTQPRTDLRTVQRNWLFDCLRRNAGCAYGIRHNFSEIHGIEDFRQYVPLSDYPHYAPEIERIAQGEADILFAGKPVAFEVTSGSSGHSKLIPYSTASLADFSRALLPWIGGMARHHGLSGSAYWAISPATRAARYTPGGIPIGLPDAAYLGEQLAPSFAGLSAVPPEVASSSNIDEWQQQTWYWLLHCADLELISIWSPTFLLALLDALPTHSDALGKRLHAESAAGNADARQALQRLQDYLASGSCQALWPRLRLVSCWRDGASRAFFDALRKRLPHAAFQPKGLLMSEGIVTLPDEQGNPVLAAQSGFYEFIGDNGHCSLAHELEQDECYEVVMTTAGGLYRYRTGDRVQCRSYCPESSWPILDFLGRAGLCSDLVGEKLTEAFVASCLPDNAGFCLLVPQPGPAPHYVLIVDDANTPPVASNIEQALCRNPQYHYARMLGQLHALQVKPVHQPLVTWQRRMLHSGMRMGDIKLVALRPETNWLDTFNGRDS